MKTYSYAEYDLEINISHPFFSSLSSYSKKEFRLLAQKIAALYNSNCDETQTSILEVCKIRNELRKDLEQDPQHQKRTFTPS